jgi:hypothetical protein
MCLFAAYVSLDRPFGFDQRHIERIRRWMTQTIYKVGEAAGQVLAGLCPSVSVEPGVKDGTGSRDTLANSSWQIHVYPATNAMLCSEVNSAASSLGEH